MGRGVGGLKGNGRGLCGDGKELGSLPPPTEFSGPLFWEEKEKRSESTCPLAELGRSNP